MKQPQCYIKDCSCSSFCSLAAKVGNELMDYMKRNKVSPGRAFMVPLAQVSMKKRLDTGSRFIKPWFVKHFKITQPFIAKLFLHNWKDCGEEIYKAKILVTWMSSFHL